MRKIIRYSVIGLLLSTLFWLTACEKTLSGNEKAAVLAFSESLTDNLFAGLTANDYMQFSRDFDADMDERVPGTAFPALQLEVEDKIGSYLSRTVEQVKKSDEFFVVVYQAKFEKEAPVTVKIAFHDSDQSIASLSFESDSYSWSAWEY